MQAKLTTSVLTLASLLAMMNSLHGGNSFPSDSSSVNTTVRTDATPYLSASKASISGNGRSVALGSDGKLRYSSDGFEWISAYLPVESFLRGLTFGNGQFVAVGGSYLDGDSVILTSVNGHSWKRHASPVDQVLHSVAYSGDQFVAVGAGGTILTSKSGRCWQRQNSGTEATFATVVYGNGAFVIGGDDGLVLSSRNALLWTCQLSGTNRYVRNIVFDQDRFVATTGDLRLESSDGSHWQAVSTAAFPVGRLLARTNVAAPRISPTE